MMIRFVVCVLILAVGTHGAEMDACDCWSAGCNWCTDTSCAVEVPNFAETGITMASKLNRKTSNTVVLFNSAGKEIGTINWNLRSVVMTGGCISKYIYMDTKVSPVELTPWTLKMGDDRVIIEILGKEAMNTGLYDECASHFADIGYVAFTNIECDTTVTYDGRSSILGRFFGSSACAPCNE